jgi:hypothetical protein
VVKTLQTSAKALAKEKKDLLTEIAESVASQLFALSATQSVVHSHRSGGDLGYLQSLSSLLRDPKRPSTFLPQGVTVFLTASSSDAHADGLFLISTDNDLDPALKGKISSILDGRGGGKKGMYQGKCKNLTPEAIEGVTMLLKNGK